eukprot:1049409_1
MANRELPKPPFHASPLYRPNRRKANAGHIEEQREKLTQALFNSEKQYNTLLHSLTQHYVVPLSTSPIITANQHKLLFHELNTIQGLSDNFLSAFQHRRLPSNWSARNSKLSDLLNAFVPFFAVYKTYANHLQFTSELIQELSVNKKWIIFTQKAQSTANRSHYRIYCYYPQSKSSNTIRFYLTSLRQRIQHTQIM